MFQSLRPNNQVFILHKDRAILETGSVVSVSTPMPKYPVQPMFGQPQEMVVDIVVKVNNQDITYQKIPANLDIADFNNSNIVLSDNRCSVSHLDIQCCQCSLSSPNDVLMTEHYLCSCMLCILSNVCVYHLF